MGEKPHVEEFKNPDTVTVNEFVYCNPGELDRIEGFEELERLCNVELKEVPYPDVPNVTIKEPITPEIMKTVEIISNGWVFDEVKKINK